MKCIVVLKGYNSLDDRSWECHADGEAEGLARWLSDNGKEAMAVSESDWQSMKAETFRDYPKSWGWS